MAVPGLLVPSVGPRSDVRWREAVRLAGRLPAGALIACVLLICVHLVARHVLVPTPRAREALRVFFDAAAGQARPQLIIAGDSRGMLIPAAPMMDVLAAPAAAGVNVAAVHCGTTVMRLLLLERAPRCAGRPIVLMCVSVWSINDGKRWLPGEGDEMLWTLPIRDRLRVASFSQACAAEFIAEGRLFEYVSRRFDLVAPAPPLWGFPPMRPEYIAPFSRDAEDRQARVVADAWYAQPRLDGVRWRQFAVDLALLTDAGFQVVLLDPPRHPRWPAHAERLGIAQTDRAFRDRLIEFGRESGVPVLSYEDTWKDEPSADEFYFDLLHLNQAGSDVFAERIAVDLRGLLAAGTLVHPDTPAAEPARRTLP